MAETPSKYIEPTLSRQIIIALVMNASVKRARQKIARSSALRRVDVSDGMLGWARPAPESVASLVSFFVSKTMLSDGGRGIVAGERAMSPRIRIMRLVLMPVQSVQLALRHL